MSTKTTYSGPLFDGDITRRLGKAANRGLQDIATLGQGKVREQLKQGHGRRTGTLQRSIFGWVFKDLHAKIDAGEKVYGRNLIYSYWVEGVSNRNTTSSFKGYRMFRRVYEWMRRMPKEIKELFERALYEEFR